MKNRWVARARAPCGQQEGAETTYPTDHSNDRLKESWNFLGQIMAGNVGYKRFLNVASATKARIWHITLISRTIYIVAFTLEILRKWPN